MVKHEPELHTRLVRPQCGLRRPVTYFGYPVPTPEYICD